jgi:hypothetical protein
MHDHKAHVTETLGKIEEAIASAPAEKQEEVRLFLEGYLAALEQEVRKRA